MKYYIYNCIVLLIFLSACKNAPTFLPDNVLDPTNENYEISPPHNFILQVNTFHGVYDSIYLKWNHPGEEYFIDGFLLNIYNPEIEEFVEYKRFSADNNHYHIKTNDLPLHLSFNLHSFVEIDIDTIRTSEPQSVLLNQEFKEIDVSLFSNKKVEVSWEHLIFSHDARIYLEKAINGSSFEAVSEFNLFTKKFTEDVNIDINDKLIYRLYAKTNYSQSDTLYSDIVTFLP